MSKQCTLCERPPAFMRPYCAEHMAIFEKEVGFCVYCFNLVPINTVFCAQHGGQTYVPRTTMPESAPKQEPPPAPTKPPVNIGPVFATFKGGGDVDEIARRFARDLHAPRGAKINHCQECQAAEFEGRPCLIHGSAV